MEESREWQKSFLLFEWLALQRLLLQSQLGDAASLHQS